VFNVGQVLIQSILQSKVIYKDFLHRSDNVTERLHEISKILGKAVAATQTPPLPARSSATMTLPPQVPAAPPQPNGQQKRLHHPDPDLRPPEKQGQEKRTSTTVAPPNPPQSQTDKKQQLHPRYAAGSTKGMCASWVYDGCCKRIGKLASSLVIYLEKKANVNQGIRMG